MLKITAAITSSLLFASALPSQITIQPPFAGVYVHTDLGSVPGVPTNYGGVVFKYNDPDKLLVGGAANGSNGAVYEIDVVRDAQGFITGFSGSATLLSTAANIDGGLCYGPNDVLFFTTYNNNTLGQIKPGSIVPDKIIPLSTFNVGSSTGTCNFVPANFAGAGELKIASYNAHTYHGFTITPDANGTFDLAPANGPVSISGGPEGILYVPPGSALIPDYTSVLISEYGFGSVSTYQVDGNGNPIPATRQVFLSGLTGAEGSCTDPITGDLVFSTYGGGSRIIRVSGFGICGSHQNYGTGIAGGSGTPTIDGGGCAGRGQITTIDIASAPPSAPGLLAVGFNATAIPVLNGALLVNPVNTFFHQTDASGIWNLSIVLPVDPLWNGINIFSQSWYLDPTAAAGVAATDGLHTLVR